jgi:NAD(P)-dependent dehydrogenase (short-subunit alcohol dehydrogenase family)
MEYEHTRSQCHFKSLKSDKCSESVQGTARDTGGHVSYISCNVMDERSVTETFAHIEQSARHPLRGLVTLAGISGRSPAVDYKISAFRQIIEVNVIGTFLCAQAAARIMQRQMVGGSIVMFASMSGTNVNKVRVPLVSRWKNC